MNVSGNFTGLLVNVSWIGEGTKLLFAFVSLRLSKK